MGFSHSPKIATEGLFLYYDPVNIKSYPGSGTVMYDLSGNARNGAILNNNVGVVDGVLKHVDRFDALRKQSVDLSGVAGYTVQMLYKRTGVNDTGTGGAGQPSYYQGVFNYYWNQSIFVGTTSNANSNNLDIFGITTTLELDQWVHITGINGPTGRRAYINGELIGTASGQTPGDTRDVYFGNWDTSWASLCEMSAIQMYDRALSAAEVQQNYNALKGRFGL
jgi:hypothetical protein